MPDMTNALVGTQQLAKLLDLTTARIQQLAAAGVLVKRGRGQFVLGEGVRNYVAFLRRRGSSSGGLDLRQERARLVRLQGDLAELELARERREVVPIDEVAGAVSEEYSAVRARLLAIPNGIAMNLAADATPAGCRATVAAAIADALRELTADNEGKKL